MKHFTMLCVQEQQLIARKREGQQFQMATREKTDVLKKQSSKKKKKKNKTKTKAKK